LIYNIAHENLRVVDLIEIFQRILPKAVPKFVPVADQDSRDYHVSAKRMGQAGFIPKVTVDLGAEEMVDAIVTGLIDDPESIFYRNAKWMKELTQFGDTKHKEFVSLMESMARSMAPAVR
jgi:hypothetical protein